MTILTAIAWMFVAAYSLVVVLLWAFQTRLIFFSGKLPADYTFNTVPPGREVWMETEDGERVHGIFYHYDSSTVLLYFHGNAGDLSGWQFIIQDFARLPYNVLMIDYRGYGKSTGRISEKGLYADGEAAYRWLRSAGFENDNILIYGRSIGTGVAVDLASRYRCKGLVLEAPFTSMGVLANEKLPLLFPSLYLRYRFDNFGKINKVKGPIVFIHGSSDDLIPIAHSQQLYDRYQGDKRFVIIEGGGHNDLHGFARYREFLQRELPQAFP